MLSVRFWQRAFGVETKRSKEVAKVAIKSSYKIPYGLDEGYADMTISLSTKDGTVGRVLPIKVVLAYVFSFLLCMYLMLNTFVGTMSTIPQKILFVILWIALTITLASFDTTRRMNIQLVPVVLNYLPKSARYVYTRGNKVATPFFNLVGIEDIYDDGLIEFIDGTYGYWYRVTGSASILLFDADKEAIVNRVDSFFRKWNSDSEVVFMTMKEAQKVERQVASLMQRYSNLQTSDQELRDLAEEQFRILKNYVGHEFKSIHQYMLIKSKNKEALMVSVNILQSEVENSSLMIKQCVPLEQDAVVEMYQSLYKKGVQ